MQGVLRHVYARGGVEVDHGVELAQEPFAALRHLFGVVFNLALLWRDTARRRDNLDGCDATGETSPGRRGGLKWNRDVRNCTQGVAQNSRRQDEGSGAPASP